MTLSIGSIAPDFTPETTQGTIHFHDWIGDSDFTVKPYLRTVPPPAD